MKQISPSVTHKFSTGLVYQLVTVLWACLSLFWVNVDRIVRDGDEEGHIGAAELYLEDLRSGALGQFLTRAWTGQDMGEYPQAFAATVGTWWWALGGGDPGHGNVRIITVFLLGLTAIAAGRLARRFVAPERVLLADTVALSTVFALPLCNGLARHFMPEGMLVLATTLAVLAAVRLTEQPTAGRALAAGAAIGFGVLAKQTFVLVAAVPLAYLLAKPLKRNPRLLAFGLLGVAVVAGPWIGTHLGAQTGYLSDSAAGRGDAAWWAHLLYYPWSVLWLGLGPVISIAALASVRQLWRQPDRRALVLGALWLVGGLALLTLLPKKYPRLMAPLLPAVSLWIAVAVCRLQHPQRWLLGGGGLAGAWLVWVSVQPLPLQLAPPGVDPGCPQQWVRPPIADDLGLAQITDAVKMQKPQQIQVIGSPEIPCTVQTTHGWLNHLGPHLRRAGHEVQITTQPSARADLVVDWQQGPGSVVNVPALSSRFWIRERATLSP